LVAKTVVHLAVQRDNAMAVMSDWMMVAWWAESLAVWMVVMRVEHLEPTMVERLAVSLVVATAYSTAFLWVRQMVVKLGTQKADSMGMKMVMQKVGLLVV
jgi:hypothetical protein